MKIGIRDEIDRRLLDLLGENARQSNQALARKLGLARSTVHERIERLQASGVIRGYAALLDRRVAEPGVHCAVLLSIDQRAQKTIVEKLCRFPEIQRCLAVTGEWDLMLVVAAPSNEDLDAVIDDVNQVEGVLKSHSLVVLSEKFGRSLLASF